MEEFNVVNNVEVWDVSDLSNPTSVGTFSCSECSSVHAVHNGWVGGPGNNYYIAAWYEAGLRVFDISNPYNINEVGKIETRRDPNQDGKYEKEFSAWKGTWMSTLTHPLARCLLLIENMGPLYLRSTTLRPRPLPRCLL